MNSPANSKFNNMHLIGLFVSGVLMCATLFSGRAFSYDIEIVTMSAVSSIEQEVNSWFN